MNLRAVVKIADYENIANADFVKLDDLVYGVLRPTGQYKTFLSLFVIGSYGELEIIRIKSVKRSPYMISEKKYISVASQGEINKFISDSEKEIVKSKEATVTEKLQTKLYDLSMIKEFEMLKEKASKISAESR